MTKAHLRADLSRRGRARRSASAAGEPEGNGWTVSTLAVTGGKTRSEYIFSELPQVADIVRSAFHHSANRSYCGSRFWVRAIPG